MKTVEERRENLQGFILGLFRPQAMLAAALARLKPVGLDVAIMDTSVATRDRPVDFHLSRLNAGRQPPTLADFHAAGKLYYEVKLDVAGRPWTVACLATPAFTAAHRTWWPWWLVLVGLAFTGLLAAYTSSLSNRRVYLEQKVAEQTADIRRSQEEVIHRLVAAAQWSDEETGMHIRRTALLSECLARAAGWFGDELEAIRQAAPMHDVGKIGIPDAILQKPGPFTPEEFDVMKLHTRIGADILAGSKTPMLQMARDIALNHHERWDGQGYPRGLAGKAIPEAARIVSIVDVYDALTHDRVYRKAMSEAEALAVLRAGSGTQFDPELVSLFFLHLDEMRAIAERNPDDARKRGKSVMRGFGGIPAAAFAPAKPTAAPLPPVAGVGIADTGQNAAV